MSPSSWDSGVGFWQCWLVVWSHTFGEPRTGYQASDHEWGWEWWSDCQITGSPTAEAGGNCCLSSLSRINWYCFLPSKLTACQPPTVSYHPVTAIWCIGFFRSCIPMRRELWKPIIVWSIYICWDPFARSRPDRSPIRWSYPTNRGPGIRQADCTVGELDVGSWSTGRKEFQHSLNLIWTLYDTGCSQTSELLESIKWSRWHWCVQSSRVLGKATKKLPRQWGKF